MTAAVLAVQADRADPRVRWDRFSLPGFDPHVYVAMAEQPAVFTLPPWGHRIAAPALAHAIDERNPLRGYRLLALGSLAVALTATGVWLRRLGFRWFAVLAAVAVVGFSVPVRQALREPFLSDPLAVALQMLFVLALAADAPVAVLAALAVAAVLAKEVLVLLPLLVVMARARNGWRDALRDGALVTWPIVLVRILLDASWTPYVKPDPSDGLTMAAAADAFGRVWAAFPAWGPEMTLRGLLPVALAGAIAVRARPYLRSHGVLIAPLLALPLVAAVWGGGTRVVPFFADDVPRLLLFVVPLLLPLALFAIDRLYPVAGVAASAPRWPRALAACGACATVLLALSPLALDRYRRLDLRGPRDGPYVLAFCRETVRTMNRLQRGQSVRFDLARQEFVWGESDPGALSRMRWFLRDGWSANPQYSRGEARTTGRDRLVLPAPGGRALRVTFALDLPVPARVRVGIAGRTVYQGSLEAGANGLGVDVPADVLVRGDNLLELTTPPGTGLVSYGIAPGGS